MNTIRRALGVGGMSVGLLVAGCTSKPAVCKAPQGDGAEAKQLASDENSFAVDLFAPVVAAVGGDAGANFVLSPYSIATTLMMIDTGAAGETDSQLQTVLHLSTNASALATSYATLACTDETDGTNKGTLTVANSLWAQEGQSFESSFTTTLATGYDAPLQQVDFASAGAESTINSWVSSATDGNIQNLLQASDLLPGTELVLVDAIYFKGTWANGFDPSDTTPAPFTLADGTAVNVPTMSASTINLGVGQGSEFQVVELPYKDSIVMDFIVPESTSTLASVEALLTSATLASALDSVGGYTQQSISLPKFAFQSRVELAPVLAGMGAPDLFDPTTANLSGMTGSLGLYVGAVVHEATILVDESGTVASAATAGDVALASVSIAPIEINRPFLFVIRDTNTGSILFMGHVMDPRQN